MEARYFLHFAKNNNENHFRAFVLFSDSDSDLLYSYCYNLSNIYRYKEYIVFCYSSNNGFSLILNQSFDLFLSICSLLLPSPRRASQAHSPPPCPCWPSSHILPCFTKPPLLPVSCFPLSAVTTHPAWVQRSAHCAMPSRAHVQRSAQWAIPSTHAPVQGSSHQGNSLTHGSSH